MAMTISDALGDTVRRARHRDDQRAARAREYFFMPSLSALRWMGNLAETHSIEPKER
jgi:hypothetical protein